MLGLLGKRKQTPLIGLDISSTTVKLLELSRSGDKYRVESYAVCSLPQDAVIEKAVNDVEGVAVAIRSVIAQSRTKLKNVSAAVAGSAVITKLIDMPSGLSDDELETQLPRPDFMRIHRGYIVALRETVELRLGSRRYFVKIANVDLEVPVSRAKVADLRARLR